MQNMSQLPTVLVVDDSSTVRAMINSQLRIFDNRIRVVFALDGFDAIQKIKKSPPSLVLADVLMPRLSGLQLCAMVKTHPATNHVPFYILSGKDGQVDKAIGRQVGADGYLIKPFNKIVLQELISSILFPEPRHDINPVAVAA